MKSILWKLYSVFFAVIVLTAPAVLMSPHPTAFDYVDLLTSVTAVLGLIGFAFRKAVGIEAFWRTAFPVLAVWEIAYNVLISQVLGLAQHGIEGGIVAWVVGPVLFGVAYFGLFQYAYGQHDFWQAAKARSNQRLERTG